MRRMFAAAMICAVITAPAVAQAVTTLITTTTPGDESASWVQPMGRPLVSATAIDLSPLVSPLIQVLGLLLTALGVPLTWALINWARSKLRLSQIGEDDAMRAVINQGLQKAIGVGVSRVEAAVAGKPMTIEIRSAVIAHAVAYAVDTIPDALAHFGLDTPEKLAAAIEARLGLMEMQTTTGQPSPGLPAAGAPAASATAKA